MVAKVAHFFERITIGEWAQKDFLSWSMQSLAFLKENK